MPMEQKWTFTGSITVLSGSGAPTSAVGFDSTKTARCYYYDTAGAAFYLRQAGAWALADTQDTANPYLLIPDDMGDRFIATHHFANSAAGYLKLLVLDRWGNAIPHQGGSAAVGVESSSQTSDYACEWKDVRRSARLELVMTGGTSGQHYISVEGQQ